MFGAIGAYGVIVMFVLWGTLRVLCVLRMLWGMSTSLSMKRNYIHDLDCGTHLSAWRRAVTCTVQVLQQIRISSLCVSSNACSSHASALRLKRHTPRRLTTHTAQSHRTQRDTHTHTSSTRSHTHTSTTPLKSNGTPLPPTLPHAPYLSNHVSQSDESHAGVSRLLQRQVRPRHPQ